MRGAQGAALGFVAGAALDFFTGKRKGGGEAQEAKETAAGAVVEEAAQAVVEEADDAAIAAFVAAVPSLAAAVSALAELAKRLDPLYLQGVRWWSGRLVALWQEGGALGVDASATASRFRREAMTLAGAASEELLKGEPSKEYTTAVADAVAGLNKELMALVGAVGQQVRANAEAAREGGEEVV